MKNNCTLVKILIIVCSCLFLLAVSLGIIAKQDKDINPPTGDSAMYTEYNNNSSN